MSVLRLPAEVWILVFRDLSFSDRLRVRATCKYFRDLVDYGSWWRDWTVELSGDENDKEGFWSTLRRWRVTSAQMNSSNSSTLAHVAKELPGLTTLIILNISDVKMQDLKDFTSLESLYLCQPDRDTPNLPTEIPLDLPFRQLKSLVFHCVFDSHPVNVLHFFLFSLPQLQHLSLRIYTDTSFEGNISDLTPLHDCPLSSLELLKCDTRKFPNEFMKMSTFPFLRSLAIRCPRIEDTPEKLSAWLRDLPALTSLMVECAHIGGGFIKSIPCSVTRLVLSPIDVKSWPELLSAMSKQLPNLHHLHLEPHYDDLLYEDTALIPQLFPRLKTLRLFHELTPEDEFLSLASLKELEVLETMDEEPLPDEVVSKLRELTNYRVRILHSCYHLSDVPCLCSSCVPAHYWALPCIKPSPSHVLQLRK